jgi:hypothetical protein
MAHFEMKTLQAEVSRMDLKPGEILIVDMKAPVSKQTISHVQTIMDRVLPEGVHYLILQGDAVFQILEAGKGSDAWYDVLVKTASAEAAEGAYRQVMFQLERDAEQKKQTVWWRKMLKNIR